MKATKRDVWPVVSRAFPAYSGRKFRVRAIGSVTTSNRNWDGGSRSAYVAVELIDDGRANALSVPAPWLHAGEGKTVEIPAGWCVVEHSMFCGKDAGITVHLRPEALARMLPNASTEAR